MTKWVLTIGCWLLAVGAYAQPKGVELDTLKVQHIDFQGQPQQGIIICNKKISNDLREIFAELYKAKYPIERIRPISEYDDNDERSMQANNTSCYCYRPIERPAYRHSKRGGHRSISCDSLSTALSPHQRFVHDGQKRGTYSAFRCNIPRLCLLLSCIRQTYSRSSRLS